jgi:zinc transport system substrate-binding protein
MKKIILLVSVLAFLSACQSKKTRREETVKVITVTILPQKTFVEKIAGEDFKINVLVPPGSNPETGNLLPSQLKDISNSEIWFQIGHLGFETTWSEKIGEANKKMKIINHSKGIDLIAVSEEHGDHVHESGVDPHIWLSPVLVKKMARQILDELTILNPANSNLYKTNYLDFVKEIDLLDIEIRNKLTPFKGKKIIIFHPSLSYFAREYGLEQHALEREGKEPTPQQLMELVDLARKENIKAIYIQNEFDRDHARVFAEEIKGKVIQIRPLDPAWTDNLREMTTIFADNFY